MLGPLLRCFVKISFDRPGLEPCNVHTPSGARTLHTSAIHTARFPRALLQQHLPVPTLVLLTVRADSEQPAERPEGTVHDRGRLEAS